MVNPHRSMQMEFRNLLLSPSPPPTSSPPSSFFFFCIRRAILFNSDHLSLLFSFLRSLVQMLLSLDYFGVSPLVWARPSCQLKLRLCWRCAVGKRIQEASGGLRLGDSYENSAFMCPNRWVWTRTISKFGIEGSLRFHPALQLCDFCLFCILLIWPMLCMSFASPKSRVKSTCYVRYCSNCFTHINALSTVHEMVQQFSSFHMRKLKNKEVQ